MTSKEIIAQAIKLEPTPRVPVSLLSAGAWTLNRSGLTLEQALAVSPERFAEVVARTNEQVGCDIVWPGSGYHNLAIRGAGGEELQRFCAHEPVVDSSLGGYLVHAQPWGHRYAMSVCEGQLHE